MDYEFLQRLNNAIADLYQQKFNSLLNGTDHGMIRETQGFIKAIKTFKEIIAESNNPVSIKEETKIEQTQYNL